MGARGFSCSEIPLRSGRVYRFNYVMVFLICGAAVFAAIVIFAAVYKYVEVRRASRWRSTKGTVIRSQVQSLKHKSLEDATDMANFPLIEYEYMIGEKKYRSKRISIGEQAADWQIEETLNRYPVGTIVEVFYNPANPGQAVLERDIPPDVIRGFIHILLFFLVLGIVLFLGSETGDAAMKTLSRHTQYPWLTAGSAAAGIFLLLLAVAMQRRIQVAQRWPSTTGTVKTVMAQKSRTFASRSWITVYTPRVHYSYEIMGRSHTGSRISFGGVLRWGTEKRALKSVSGYQEGHQVIVYYNPLNHAESMLDPDPLSMWILWGITALAFGITGFCLL